MDIISHMSNAAVPADLPSLAERWLHSRQLRPNTVRAYEHELSRFFEWLVVGPAGRLQDLDLQEFLHWRSNEFAAANGGVLPRVGSLLQAKRIVASFLRFAAAQLDQAESERWRPASTQIAALADSTDDAAALRTLGEILADGGSRSVLLQPSEAVWGERLDDRLLTAIAFWTCATTTELTRLRLADVSVDGTITIGEGAARRRVALPASIARELLAYIKPRTRRGRSRETVFVGENGNALSPSSLRRRLNALATQDGVRPSPRTLRRLFAQLAAPQPISPGATAYRQGKKQARNASEGRDLMDGELAALCNALIALPGRATARKSRSGALDPRPGSGRSAGADSRT